MISLYIIYLLILEGEGMKLASLLDKDCVKMEYAIKSKEEAISFLIDTVTKTKSTFQETPL